MALVEKQCRFCETFFYYDDGTDTGGLALSHSEEYKPEKIRGHCPQCDDPHFIPGETYQKDVIVQLFKKHLEQKGVNTTPLTKEMLIDMMKSFPRTYTLFSSNGTFRTFNLYTGSRFTGDCGGEFEIMPVEVVQATQGMFAYFRGVKCVRCSRIVTFTRKQALEFYIGLKDKSCFDCDRSKRSFPPSDHERNTSGLNRNGSSKSEYSDRAMAKALNVSRNDYQRYDIRERVEPLMVGTIIGGLTITEAFWDEDPDSYSPKYVLVCKKCRQTFVCIQKRVRNYQHFC